PEPLYIPFDAIRTFVDPSVEFGLRFETQDGEDDDEDEEDDDDLVDAEAPRQEAEVVSLDKWRK
ncbi:MAG: ClpXP protease specificity-enhancing factor SspB, partial [Albidovulum sp.]|uniref:ClpXP protease specificity-enhancing factor SspB n=1 Tax=Albidovulum sp. TaxID=1872424 RepID=UPI003C8A479E